MTPETPEQTLAELGVSGARVGGLWKIQCYNLAGHKNGDSHPSLTLYDNGYFCFSCGEHGTYRWLIKQFRGYTPPQGGFKVAAAKEYKQYDLNAIWRKLPGLPAELDAGIKAKGFTRAQLETQAGWRWHLNEIAGWRPGVFIPYRAGDNIVTARLRCVGGSVRFLALPGGESYPYGLNTLHRPYVFVTEGESDMLTLNFAGVPAVGVPGATNSEAIKKLVAEASTRGTMLFVAGDNDEAGGKFRERVLSAAFRANVSVQPFMVPSAYKDLNDWSVAVGTEAMLEHLVDYLMGVTEFAEAMEAKRGVVRSDGVVVA